jgi:uncharacterized protein YuzE
MQRRHVQRVEIVKPTGVLSARAVRVVADLDWQGNVIGIEMLFARAELGDEAVHTDARTESPQRFSYDAESDALYLKVAEGASANQRSCGGVALLDSRGRLVALDAEIA